MKNTTPNTNSFSIAQYILLFLVVIGCIALVTWTLISTSHKMTSPSPEPTAPQISNDDPCTQHVRNIVSQAWLYAPDLIPIKYVDIAHEYMNAQIIKQESGLCSDRKYTCRRGQIRRDCNPCAAYDAQQFAIDTQVADIATEHCQKTNTK